MIDTRNTKVEFGHKAYNIGNEKHQLSTLATEQVRWDSIKVTHKKAGGKSTYGYKTINCSEMKLKETYKKINRMLGGN